MQKVRDAVAFLNPGQVPVITADQPIYALANHVQWQWPDRYWDDKYLVMFGGLHIEMAALKSLGTLLRDSGWTGALVEAGVVSSATAVSLLSVSSVTKTRQIHKVKAVFSIFWKLLITSTAMNKQITLWMYSVLRGGVHVGKNKVHSFTSGMWCFLWS